MALSKPFSSNPIGWTTFYDRNKHDGGGVQRLFEASLETLSIITTSHFKKPDKLVETIAGSTYANMMMVAGDDDGSVLILHHGFVNASTFGGETSILFLSGNSSEAPFKSLAQTSAVVPIKTGSGRTRKKATTIDSPTLADMLKIDSEDDFANLKGGGNTILQNKPNHMMIGPAVFMIAEGAQRIQAKTLAHRIIRKIKEGDDASSAHTASKRNATYNNDDHKSDDGMNNEDDIEEEVPSTPPTIRNPADESVIDLLDSGLRTSTRQGRRGGNRHPTEIELQRPRGGAGVDAPLQEVDGNQEGDEDHADEYSNETYPEDPRHIEHLLAWLWACEQKMVPCPKVQDPIFDDAFVARARRIRSKLNEEPGMSGNHSPHARNDADNDHRDGYSNSTTNSTHDDRGARARSTTHKEDATSLRSRDLHETGLSNLAMTTKEIAGVLERMENNRRQEHRKKESDKSFLRNIGTMQRELFSTLCTDELGEMHEHPTFLKGLMDTKTPQKAIAMIRSEIWEWEGSFFDGPFHRFLANGYLSRDGNKGSPGGFTLFMFCPKNVEASLNTNKSDIALLRDYFGLDVDDDTVNHYARQGWFYPSNHYDLRVQLKTACSMLELLTGEGSIASHGLSYILNQKRWDRYAPLLAERFKTENLFGAKFVYCLDRNLQVFFAKLSKWDPNDPLTLDPNYLRNKAEGLLDKVDDGHSLGTILPSTIYGPAGAKRAIEQDAAGVGENSPNKKGKANPNAKNPAPTNRPGYIAPLTTAALLASAKCPTTMPSLSGCSRKDRSITISLSVKIKVLGDGHSLMTPRLPNGPAPMCIRFQTTGKCRSACRMAHVSPDMITAEQPTTH